MAFLCPGGSWFRIDRLNTHEPHQALNTLTVHMEALIVQPIGQHPATKVGSFQVELINSFHDRKIFLGLTFRLVVEARATQG